MTLQFRHNHQQKNYTTHRVLRAREQFVSIVGVVQQKSRELAAMVRVCPLEMKQNIYNGLDEIVST